MVKQDLVNLIHFLHDYPTFKTESVKEHFGLDTHKVFFCPNDILPYEDAAVYMAGDVQPKQLRAFIDYVDHQMDNIPESDFMFSFPISSPSPRRPGEKRAAFVAIPYGPDWSEKVTDAIVKVGNDEGFACVVSKDLRKPGTIIKQIWEDIRKAEVVIADITSDNPNVLYELGLAKAIGKQCILLKQEGEKFPFDVSQERHIFYPYNPQFPSKLDTLKSELAKAFRQVKQRYKFDKVEEPTAEFR